MSVYNETVMQLEAAMDSILKQTLSVSEFIIVLDNPERKDLKITLKQYADRFNVIHLIFNETNIGLAQSLNLAASTAKCDYLARMDADDIAMPNRMEVEMAQLQDHPEWALVSGNINYIDENSDVIGEKSAIPENPRLISKILPLGSTIIHPTVIIKKEVFDQVEGYRLLPTAEDYDLWLRILDRGYCIGSVNTLLLKYRLRNNSMTADAWKTYVVSKYIQKLAKQRQLSGTDDFDRNQSIPVSLVTKINNEQFKKQFNLGQRYFTEGLSNLKEKRRLKGVAYLLKCTCTSKENRDYVWNYVKLRLKYLQFNN
ncbi:glycosyltransferase [Lactiplantibacillus modestisalitolerans]|uniref:Glycosyltransferase n=2 Tax=Lactiplantibacillus modestisalitolerans TaxID=1457219 RepID=A0ABV5WVZ0_9LACO